MVYNYFGATYNTSDKINQDGKETATQTLTHVNNREEQNHPALVKNNELPFIRRGIHTYFRDSNKEGRRDFRPTVITSYRTSGYSELGNHMLMRSGSLIYL